MNEDDSKNEQNIKTHNVSFYEAQKDFADTNRIILTDETHSQSEAKYYCSGKVTDGRVTIRFTYRNEIIRIIGAGYWRKGKKIYEEENKIYE